MRFCMLTTFYPPHHFGGDATYVRALSRELVQLGHHVEVVYCEDAFNIVNQQGRPNKPATDDGVVVHRLKSRLGPLSPLITQQTGRPGLKHAAIKEILAQNFDVVHFHNISLLGGPAVLKLSRAPVTLYSLHEHWLLCPTHIFWKNRQHACDKRQCFQCSMRSSIPPQLWRYTGLIDRCLSSADLLLSPSRYTMEKHQEGGVKQDIRVLPLFSMLEPGEPEAVGAVDACEFLYVGRMTASKGLVPLVKLFARMPQYRLKLIGEGELLEALKSEFGALENIDFMGGVDQAELICHYQGACAVILPSLAPETFGLTVAEAFASGTPALVRKAGGSRELIETTGGGFVYEDDEELELYIHRLSNNTALRTSLSKKAREGYLANYTVAQHMQAYLGHIEDTLQRKGMTGDPGAETG